MGHYLTLVNSGIVANSGHYKSLSYLELLILVTHFNIHSSAIQRPITFCRSYKHFKICCNSVIFCSIWNRDENHLSSKQGQCHNLLILKKSANTAKLSYISCSNFVIASQCEDTSLMHTIKFCRRYLHDSLYKMFGSWPESRPDFNYMKQHLT